MSKELLESIINEFPQNHPERLEDEVFLSNNLLDDVVEVGWKTKRIGRIAYCRDGTISEGAVPVFVKKKEILESKQTIY